MKKLHQNVTNQGITVEHITHNNGGFRETCWKTKIFRIISPLKDL